MIYIKNKILPWLPAFIWMGFIFSLSAQPAAQSNGLSKGITKLIVETVGKFLPLNTEVGTTNYIVSNFNHFIRKFAHFFIYMILGILVESAFIKNELYGYRLIIYSLIVCTLYASSDEFHQLFVPGRGGQIKDVLIDSCGALIGILIYSGYRLIMLNKN